MNELDQIVENRIPVEKIRKMYLNNQISWIEKSLLLASREKAYLEKFLLGRGEYKVSYDSTVPQDMYFVNIPAVLNTFYLCYHKYPDYHFDKILEMMLEELSMDRINLYEFLNIFSKQLENEVKKVSPFKIVNVEMLKNSKKNLQEVKEFYKNIRDYEAKNRENGYMDVISDLNENFKQNLKYDILNDEEVDEKVQEQKGTRIL